MRGLSQDGAIALAMLLALPAALVAQDAAKTDTEKENRAQYNWVMHCQGCHGAEAQGTLGGAPRMAGNVSRFLQIKAGRAYLGRVPGVAFVNLSDAEVAELLNWVVQRFDEGNLPKTFAPYSENEIRVLRRKPLISDAHRQRQKLLKLLSR
jgi:cytochrome c553